MVKELTKKVKSPFYTTGGYYLTRTSLLTSELHSPV